MKISSFPIKPLIVGALVLGACQGEKKRTAVESEELQGVSARPEQVDRFMTTIQLSLPPLLGDDGMVDGKVNPDLRDRLLKQHEEFKERLAYISADIEIVYEYKMLLNGFTLVVPGKYADRLESLVKTMDGASFKPQKFARATAAIEEGTLRNSWGEVTSASFINSTAVHDKYNLRGEGIKVGVIDTGIDYTHKMFGGAGTSEAYQANDPTVVAEDFPTAKVVGGYDFVGATYNSGSSDWSMQVPSPDPDPIDESGHGTHVAGTIAGLGDGTNTYDGVAPQAELYALKVFGIAGSTSDSVVIAAMEYAVDPNGDLDPSDRLDVVNLSLGGGFGSPNSLYDVAVKNLANGGTVAVIAAGNSGDTPFIVGSPSTAKEAISVAASVDAMDHNWKTPASEVFYGDAEEGELVGITEGGINAPIAGFNQKGKLVSMGLGTEAPTDEVKQMVTGNLAFIKRGENPFCEKGENALAAGAIGFVVANNVEGAPIAMGGDCEIAIPGVMISLEDATKIEEAMATGDVLFVMDSGKSFEYPEKVDKITGFSSRGPRSIDALLKPEISAPGQAIVSASVGGGDRGVRLSGTSMAAPHVAGVAALVRQKYPNSSVAEVKSRMVNTSKPIDVEENVPYPLSRQGAGRVDVLKAVESMLSFSPATISLGHVNVVEKKASAFKFQLRNEGYEPIQLNIGADSVSPEWIITVPRSVTIPAQESITVHGSAMIQPRFNASPEAELDAHVTIYSNGNPINQIPVHALRHRSSDLKVEKFTIAAGSAADAVGASGELQVRNNGGIAGTAFPFNLLATDERQASNSRSTDRSFCDLQAVGYRVVESWSTGTPKTYLEIGFKLYSPLTNWFFCEATALIDVDNDNVADYEVFGDRTESYTADFDVPLGEFSILVDAQKMKQIRKNYDTTYSPSSVLDYKEAILDVQPFSSFNYSTFAILRLDVDALPTDWREMKIKPGILGGKGDDFIDGYRSVFTDPFEASYFDFEATLEVGPYDYEMTRLTKGVSENPLVLFYPQNAGNLSLSQEDDQSETAKPEYKF